MASRLYDREIEVVKYANEKHNLIEVMYKTGENRLASYYVPIEDPNNEDLLALENMGYSFEKIYQNTVDWNKRLSLGFKQLISFTADQEIKFIKERYDNQLKELAKKKIPDGRILLTQLLDMNKNPKAVREAKLYAFDLIEENNTKKIKTKLRKAKTISEIFNLIDND